VVAANTPGVGKRFPSRGLFPFRGTMGGADIGKVGSQHDRAGRDG
jgi:hypothetical protein